MGSYVLLSSAVKPAVPGKGFPLRLLVGAGFSGVGTGCLLSASADLPRPLCRPLEELQREDGSSVAVRPSWFPCVGVSNLVTVVAAAVALALSVANFLELRWRNRTASLSARWETYKPAPFTSDYQEYRKAAWLSGLNFERVVVTNYGPAVAHDVRLRVVEGEVVDLGRHVFPVPLLHSGQEIHAQILKTAEQEGPRSVELSWKDKRRGVQTRSVMAFPSTVGRRASRPPGSGAAN